MWRLMIADDEPRIRSGLRKSIDWEEKRVEVIGEAEDGEEALERASILKPDIMLVDIYMPFINGLELISKLKHDLPNCIFIVITGHDEFNYAQQAIKLEVFDYLLKPVVLDELTAVIDKSIEVLDKSREYDNYFNWVHEKVESSSLLQSEFFEKWLEGRLSQKEVEKELHFLNLDLKGSLELILIKPVTKVYIDGQGNIWDKKSQALAIKNTMLKILEKGDPYAVFIVEDECVVTLVSAIHYSEGEICEAHMERKIEEALAFRIFISQKEITSECVDVTGLYRGLMHDMYRRSFLTPIVENAKQFIESYYYQCDLSLKKVACQMQVSPAYLSKLLKKELGYSFVDYLTSVRVLHAVRYLGNPSFKIYEIAEQVGYNSQHYFSNAFKKIMGVSPIAYRKGSDLDHKRA